MIGLNRRTKLACSRYFGKSSGSFSMWSISEKAPATLYGLRVSSSIQINEIKWKSSLNVQA